MAERDEWTQERIENLGLTPEEAKSLLKSWNYRAPEDPKELQDLARRASEYDRRMGGLSTDLREGRIKQEEYFDRADELNLKFFPERHEDE